jgi:hypothetical protein
MPVQRLRPIASVFRQGIIACVAFMTPVFVVLYFMSIPNGPWLFVLVSQIVISLAIGISSWRFFQLAIWVSSDSIAERGFFRLHRAFSGPEIGSIVFAQAYSGPEIQPQLFVRSPSGATIVRMRGQFWTRESMETVMETLDAPVEIIDDPVSIAELRDSIPTVLYWFERRPVVAGIAFAAGLIALGAVVLIALRLTGVLA